MNAKLKLKLYEIVFEADTRAGKIFDIVLLFSVLMSVAAVMLDSIESVNLKYHRELRIIEWVFTVLFTIEYFLRIAVIHKKSKYIFSFFGIIDL